MLVNNTASPSACFGGHGLVFFMREGSVATAYAKPHLTLAEQVELLQSRGLQIPNAELAMRWLGAVGYYRLSAYWYPYRILLEGSANREDRFVTSTSFDQVIELYEFDRRLKLLVLDALERIEIAMRFRVGYTLGRRSAYAHLEPSALDGNFATAQSGKGKPSSYEDWLTKVLAAQDKSREDFVVHFRTKYDGRLPVWVATEILDFGCLSFLYAGLKRLDRDEIAHNLGVLDDQGAGNGKALANWMHVLNYLRNTCAHHARLWNRNMALQVASKHLKAIASLRHLHTANTTQIARLFGALCVVAFLMDQVSPGHTWTVDMTHLVTESLPLCNRSLSEMGFPDNWESLPLWRVHPTTD